MRWLGLGVWIELHIVPRRDAWWKMRDKGKGYPRLETEKALRAKNAELFMQVREPRIVFCCCLFVCLFVSYLFRVGHSTDMCSLLQENLLGGKKESVSRLYVHVC